MAEGLNRVLLLGNLGAEPELRHTKSGEAVLNMRVATTESYLDRDKIRKEKTEWHNVVMWGKRGESLSKHLHKGTGVCIEGSLRTSSYDAKDGTKRYKTEVNARNLVFTGGTPRDNDGRDAEPARGQSFPRPPEQADFADSFDDDGSLPF